MKQKKQEKPPSTLTVLKRLKHRLEELASCHREHARTHAQNGNYPAAAVADTLAGAYATAAFETGAEEWACRRVRTNTR